MLNIIEYHSYFKHIKVDGMRIDTSNRDEKRNVIFLIGKDSFSILSQTLISLTIVQAFLLSLGVQNFQLGVLNTLFNGALMLGMFLFMGKIDTINMGKIMSVNRKLVVTLVLFPAILVFTYIMGNKAGSFLVFAVVALGWCIQNFFIGIRVMTESRIYRNIFRPETYGFVFGLDGIIFYTLAMLAGFLIKPLLDRSDGINGYGTLFIISLLIAPASVFFNSKLRLIGEQGSESNNGINNPFSSFSHSFRISVLRNISLLHVMRGALNGMFVFILPVGVKYYGIPLSYAAYIIISNSAAGIIGYLFIYLFYDRIGTLKSVFIGAFMCFLAVAGLVATKNPTYFLLSVTFFVTGQTIFLQSVPNGTYKVVPSNFIGTFSGIRFFIMQTTEAIFAFMMGIMINKLSIVLYALFLLIFLVLIILFAKLSFRHEESNDKYSGGLSINPE